MLDEKAEEANLVDESWQVVVQEQRPLDEEIRYVVNQIAEEENKANVLKFSPFLFVQINDLSTPP